MSTFCNGKVNAVQLKTNNHRVRACLVCGRFTHALCCGACKKVFRRNVIQQDVPPCANDSKCDVTKVQCRYCRHQKFLLVGMEMDREFVKIKYAENFDRFIEGLKQTGQSFKRIWDTSGSLPETYTKRHKTLALLLQDNYNLLANADQFVEIQFCCDKAQFLHDMETNGPFSMHALNVQIVKDRFIMVEFAKTLAFFNQLNLEDQISQIKHVGMSVNFIFNAYFSHTVSAKCVTRKNGLPMTAFLEAKQIRDDQKIRPIFIQSACRLVEMMSETGLEYDEFLLLLLIVLSNSTADGLSVNGRELLYNESIHYSKELHKLLQFKFGFFGGSQKFAALMNVLNYAIRIKYNFIQMLTYIEVFYAKCEYLNIPKDYIK